MAAAQGVLAQVPERWNDARALALVERAREVRESVVIDSAFHSYRGEARGYVYFFIDRPDSDDRTLVKADQIALDVFWQAPNDIRQQIVGLRDAKVLPTNIRYHLDHLTVVQDDFGDFIRLGDGDEVEQVLHPVGPASEDKYDFLLADSLTISYGGGAKEVRVYELRIRPRDYDAPGFVGSIFLDRASAAIVRMNFTFTPAAYVDPYLDYIRISLDNALWEGKYWLPYRQEVELRRELPVLDFLAGSIIRGRFEIGGYEFNADMPPAVRLGRRVTSVSAAERAAFPFERGLFDDLQEDGLASSPSMAEIRERASQILRQRFSSGLSPIRLYFGSASDLSRHNRAEGQFWGAGVAVRPERDVVLRTTVGYATGRDKASGAFAATGGPGPVVPTFRAYWDGLADMGQTAGASPLVNSLATTLGIGDYLDPYFKRGVQLTFSNGRPGGSRVSVRMERHESATDVVSDSPGQDLRSVRSVQEGTLGAVDMTVTTGLPLAGRSTLTGTFGHLDSNAFGSLLGEARWTFESSADTRRVEVSASAGAVSGGAPAQTLFLLGGRETLPGHAYRDFVGDRFWLVKTEATLPLRAPGVSARVFGAVGASYLGDRILPADWAGGASQGVRASVGVGLAFGWDVVRLDLGRGVRGGGWEVVFSVAPKFRPWL
mgnify:CR=1 FL=1|jgi:hypothetical protein